MSPVWAPGARGNFWITFSHEWLFSAKKRPVGATSGLFLLGYGSFRFFVEYFREPDAHIGLYQLGLSQGQLLCLPMIALGLALIIRAYTRSSTQVEQTKT